MESATMIVLRCPMWAMSGTIRGPAAAAVSAYKPPIAKPVNKTVTKASPSPHPPPASHMGRTGPSPYPLCVNFMTNENTQSTIWRISRTIGKEIADHPAR